jgi:hypothetical protein
VKRFAHRGCIVATAISLALLVSITAPAESDPAIARVMHGVMLSYAQSTKQGYGGVVAYGTPVGRKALARFGPPNPSSTSCAGERCFGLGTYDGGMEFPLISSNGGRSWSNGGHWFAGAWADGSSFASTMTTFSSTTAVAWFPGENTFYVTSTAGRVWYAAWPEGEVIAVSSPNRGSTFVMRVRPYSHGASFEYRSTDGGRQWIDTR